jgi:hypothetical protein
MAGTFTRVMPGLVPGIHASVCFIGTLMAGTSPAVTADDFSVCEQFTQRRRLPDKFEEIASASLAKGELFVMSDGECTCVNRPAVDRLLGKTVDEGSNWTCKFATSEERKGVEELRSAREPSLSGED